MHFPAFCFTVGGAEDGIQVLSGTGRGMNSKTSNTTTGISSADLKDSVAFEICYSVPEVQAVFALLKDNRVLFYISGPSCQSMIVSSIAKYMRRKRISSNDSTAWTLTSALYPVMVEIQGRSSPIQGRN
jgi:hypothetical protein